MANPSYSAPVRRSTILLGVLGCLLGAPAIAAPPQFSAGGFTFSLNYGPSLWAMDEARLARQVDALSASLAAREPITSHGLGLRLAYNILGHVSVGLEFLATGWNITTDARGGAGFLGGSATWHPLELAFRKKDKRPIPIDVGVLLGAGYGIVGRARGLDGAYFQLGLLFDYYVARYFAVGLAMRTHVLLFDKLYLNYNDMISRPLPEGSGGANVHLALTLTLRAGD